MVAGVIPSARLATAVTAVALLSGCTGQGSTPHEQRPTAGEQPRPLAWKQTSLPNSLEPVVLAPAGEGVLVGAYSGARPSARVLVGDTPVSLHEVPATPHSPYAFEARWLALADHAGAVVGVGGARGGAHANVRWTTWSGDATHLAEYEQTFETFGGWGAGDLAGVAFAGSEPVVLGSWQSERTGLDIATWRQSGHRWERQSSTGTALGSTPQELLSAGAVASAGAGLVASGSVTRLGTGSIATIPAVWLSPSASGPWRRVDLPAGGGPGQADAATCTGDRCMVVGRSGAHLAMWDVAGDTARAVSGIPSIVVPDNHHALAPLAVDGQDVVVVPVAGGSSRLVVRRGSSWTQRAGPPGVPRSAVALGGELWLVTEGQEGRGALWHAKV